MRGNAPKNTGPEVEMRRLLREAGFPGYRLHWKKAPGRPDIAYPGRKLAIFVHGCFWHRCPTCQPSMPRSNSGFWELKFERNQERDARKIADLIAAGWRVVVAWECRIRKTPGEVIGEVALALRSGGGAGETDPGGNTDGGAGGGAG